MKKLKMTRGITLTFEEGCNKYLENCPQRNLREDTESPHFELLFRFLYSDGVMFKFLLKKTLKLRTL